ncbi:MAG: mechanosensitive ion channel family protein [Bacteroidales bacterium]|nr:mechanosensitive ion channel family protein [Bacteroidales bacterium]
MDNFLSGFQIATSDLAWQRYLTLFTLILVLFLVGKLVRYLTKKASNRQLLAENPVYASFLGAIANSVTFFLVVIGLVIGSNILLIPEQYHETLVAVKKILIVISIGYIIYQLIDVPGVWFATMVDKQEKASVNRMFIPVIRKTLRLSVIIMVILQIFQVLYDKPITTVIAGLGIGSLAIALAAQDTLKHFIGSFVIAGDKPFEIGQRVAVDGHEGTIESIGLRSTNIRTLDGHVVTIPNGELANRTIRNIGQRPFIRRLANITITYDTPPEKIQKAIDILKEILDNHEGMNPELPPRVYFNEFNSTSLNLEVTYWYHPPDYWGYMAFTEKVNFEIIRRFNAAGIDFAFPTQTLHLAGDPKRPLNVGLNEKLKS